MDNPPIFAAGATWSPIAFSPQYYARLRSLIPKRKKLARSGYVMEPFSEEKILAQQRCQNCRHKLQKKFMDAVGRKSRDNMTFQEEGEEGEEDKDHEEPKGETSTTKLTLLVVGNPPPQQRKPGEEQDPLTERKKPSKSKCRYHPGELESRNIVPKSGGPPRYTSIFTCCYRDLFSPGCMSSDAHESMIYPPHMTLFDMWTFYPTPISMPKRFAVALDCEMGQSFLGENEIIRISLIDYFTGEILIDSLVLPMNDIMDYRTPWSGVTAKDMNAAVVAANFINGREMALRMVWNYVGPETVVIVHGGANDLRDLKWIHGDIVDSVNFSWPGCGKPMEDVQPRNDAQPGGSKPSGTEEQPRKDGKSRGEKSSREKSSREKSSRGKKCLKSLSKEILGKNIQKKRGHCSLEDAFACRELVHWWVLNGAQFESESALEATVETADIPMVW
ncbi:hypothetical protein RUND412_008968 [Rhizina undulata]